MTLPRAGRAIITGSARVETLSPKHLCIIVVSQGLVFDIVFFAFLIRKGICKFMESFPEFVSRCQVLLLAIF